ncbi:MAG: response regulator transcription factor [Abitibacteriaceae bacterium]|nr:response regulator transcription factor [Abditibacteriaceae bacterium]MBV9867864.1 response regulator transcription factor [Abditibacteriaceae bacterium]
MNPKILIVDDERMLVETIEYNLQKAGFETLTAYDGETALAQVKAAKPQLVILDLMLPKLSGWEVCRVLRHDPDYRLSANSLKANNFPAILMLTARGEESDRVIGLEMGADDYLIKPFSMREFVARVRALLRRAVEDTSQEEDGSLQVGNVQLDVARHEVSVQADNGNLREVKLSLKEFELLRVLLTQSGQAVPREKLLERVWGDDFFGDERTLDVHIRWLREKLEPNPSQPQHILTVRGVGYKFKE